MMQGDPWSSILGETVYRSVKKMPVEMKRHTLHKSYLIVKVIEFGQSYK